MKSCEGFGGESEDALKLRMQAIFKTTKKVVAQIFLNFILIA